MAYRHFQAWLFLALGLFHAVLYAQPERLKCPELFGALGHLSPKEISERTQAAYEEFLHSDDPALYQRTLTRNYQSSLPPIKFREIKEYTEEGYKALNSSLVMPSPRLAFTLRWRDRIIEELARLPATKGWVYSGAGLSQAEFSKFREAFGKSIDFPYFFSTSKDRDEAIGFVRRQFLKKDPDRVMVLFSVRSKSGKDVSAHSVFPDEKEILFSPGTSFRVTSLTRQMDEEVLGEHPFWKIELEEVDQKPVEIPEVKNPKDYEFSGEIDLKRFGSYGPWLNNKEFEDWKKAYEAYVRSKNEHEISLNTLQEIHKQAMSNAFFSGFERRRIKRDYRMGGLGKVKAIEKLMAVDQQVSYTSTKSEKLAGKLRENALDSFEYEGDLQSESLERFIPAEELEGLLANPFFRVEPDSVEKVDDSKYRAKFHYVPPRFVEDETRKVIETAAAQLKAAKNNESYVRTALTLHRDLITIHPFLDGNGRSIRLFIDMIFAKRNIPLPLTPFEKEYSSSIDTILRQTAIEMNKWQIEKVQKDSN